MSYGLSNSHVTDDVTWPWKVKFVTPICLERNLSKMTGFRDSVPQDHNRKWHTGYGLSNSHVTGDDTWPPKVLQGSMVGYPSDSLASCLKEPTNCSNCCAKYLFFRVLTTYTAVSSLLCFKRSLDTVDFSLLSLTITHLLALCFVLCASVWAVVTATGLSVLWNTFSRSTCIFRVILTFVL